MSLLCAVSVVTALAYGSGPSQVGDLYVPEKISAETPVVLSIHGGGWNAMCRQDVRGIAEFLSENGCAVYNVDYRLATPSTPWPACGDDCLSAARFLLDGGLKAHGIRAEKIWVIGASAGGHLSLWTGLNLPAEKIAGIVSISGIADPLPDAAANPARYRALFGGHDPSKEEFGTMDIVRLAKRGGPRILLTHAVEDTVVPMASARNFYLAYQDKGEISFSQYSAKDEPNTGGHCIWRKGVANPRRLIARIENEILHFMGRTGVDEYGYEGSDFARMFAADGWQAAFLTSGPLFGKLSFLERHMKADELFVLLSGTATLYQGEPPAAIPMVQGRVYNVRKGTWHGIAVEPGGRVLVVEKSGSGATEKRMVK